MLFRNDETMEEREAREEIFGSKLPAPVDEAPAMEVDRLRMAAPNPPDQGPSIQEPREIIEPAKVFGLGSIFGTNVSNPAAPPPADRPAASSASTAPLEPHLAPRSSTPTPFIRAPAPTASTSGGPTSAPAVPSIGRAAAADEEDEDEEMPEINIESDSE
jgi:hypothetical protein